MYAKKETMRCGLKVKLRKRENGRAVGTLVWPVLKDVSVGRRSMDRGEGRGCGRIRKRIASGHSYDLRADCWRNA